MNSGGTVTPGVATSDGTEDITTANLLINSGGIYEVEIGGTTDGVDHDQIDVTGTVDVSGATLNLTLDYVPANSDTLVIIDNDDTDAVTGEFVTLPDGTIFDLVSTTDGNTYTFEIDYQGGTGNDVVLIAQGQVETTVEVVGGNLVITDVLGGDSDDNLTISEDGAGNYIISDSALTLGSSIPGAVRVDANTISVSKTGITGLIFDTLDNANDTVTIGGSNPISFAGDVVINAEAINLNQSIDAGATGDVTFNGPVTMGANATVAGNDVKFYFQR